MYHNLVLSGGSLKGIAFIGVLQYLEENKLMDSVHNYIGVSFGALVCFYTVIGFKSREIVTLFKHHIQQYKPADPETILNIFYTMGIDDGTYLESCLRKVLHYKLGVSDITFLELAKATGKNLVVTVANITNHTSEHCNVDTTPDLSVIKALRMSCSIPLVFTPVEYKNNLYVDGGLFCNFPLDYFNNDKTPFRDTIGIVIENSNERTIMNKIPCNMIEYLQALLYSVFYHINDKGYDNRKNNVVVITFQDKGFLSYQWDTLSFSIDGQLVDQYITNGYESASNAFKTSSSQETQLNPVQEHSRPK